LGKPNDTLLAQAIRIYQVNSHQNTSKVKTRGEVVGSTRKIYAQKGTGNARHGARYAPIFVGGGIAHGPKGVKAQPLTLPKKMRRHALRSALVHKFIDKSIIGLSGIDKLDGKTSSVTTLFAKIAGHPKNKTLVITHDQNTKLYRSLNNLQKIELKSDTLINALDLVRADFIVVTKPAIESLLNRATNQILSTKN